MVDGLGGGGYYSLQQLFFFFFSFSSFYFSVVVSCIRNEVGGSDPSYQKKKVSLYYSLDMYLKLVFL